MIMTKKETKKENKTKTISGSESITYVDKSGKRLDGRTVDQIRPIKIKVGVLKRADGSCYLEWGQNKIIAAVYGPRECLPKHHANPYQATIRYTYRMATFSVSEHKNPKPGRREIEISKVSGEALEKAVMTEKFPGAAIDVFVEVLDSNAGTRIAALTAASIALADAGIPMRDMVAGITVGRAGGHLVVDLTKAEEDAPDAVDIAMAFLPNSQEVTLLQMDGQLPADQWKKVQLLALEGVKQVSALQRSALQEKYSRVVAKEGH